MFDLKWIRDHPEAFDRSLIRRGDDPLSAQVLELDARRRDAQTRLQEIQKRRNTASKQIGAAMQDNVLIAGSVRQNICLDRASVDQDEMIRAAEISGTHRFMGQIANGYDLRLADRGDGLSGGQRQSIALARALAGRPQLLIFDEPSSSMDAQTEADLIARLRPEVAGRTMLLITHRTSLLTLVDRIIVMDRGKIVADGPRDAVLQRLARGKAA